MKRRSFVASAFAALTSMFALPTRVQAAGGRAGVGDQRMSGTPDPTAPVQPHLLQVICGNGSHPALGWGSKILLNGQDISGVCSDIQIDIPVDGLVTANIRYMGPLELQMPDGRVIFHDLEAEARRQDAMWREYPMRELDPHRDWKANNRIDITTSEDLRGVFRDTLPVDSPLSPSEIVDDIIGNS